MSLSINLKFSFYTIVFGAIALLILGIPTAVIKNSLYVRMTPIYWFDYIFLILNSMLIGLYFASTYTSKKPRICEIEKTSIFAQVLSFLGIACPICNKILLFVFGTTFLLTYLEPIRPYVSLISTIILFWLVTKRIKYVNLKTQ